VLQLAGEDADGLGTQCPGEGKCERFTAAAGKDLDEKAANACPGCPKECTPPVDSSQESVAGSQHEDDEISDIVDEIEMLAAWDNAGFPTDWSLYSFGHKELFKIWRDAENFVHRQQQVRISSFILGWIKQGEK